MGITPSLADQSCPLNGIILFGFFILVSVIYCSIVFIVLDAGTFAEYTQAVYTGSLGTLIIFGLLILIIKVKNLFEFIDNTDKLVNTSEKHEEHVPCRSCLLYTIIFFLVFQALKYSASRSIFNETVQFEHKLSELIFVVMVKHTIRCALLPFLIYTYFVHFTTDSGPEAFELPFPLW